MQITRSPRSRRPVLYLAHGALASLLASACVGACAQAPSTEAGSRYPATAKRPVSDEFKGVSSSRTVVDDYRWLETLDDPAVKDWVTLQNTATRRILDAMPSRNAIRDELKALIGNAPVSRSSMQYEGGKLFALKRQPPKNQPMLVMLDGPDAMDSERVVVDPNQRNEKGTTAIDWYVPSRDAKYVAVSFSDNGSEQGTLRIFETATGNELSDVVPRVQNPTGGGSVAWNADSTGLWYTRYPAPMERPKEDAGFYQQVYFHTLGTRATFDTYALGKELPRIAETRLETSADGRYVLADVRNGDGGEVGFWLRGPTDKWRRLAGFDEGFKAATFGRDGRIYALALKGSPRGRIVAMKPEVATLSKAATVVPQGDGVIDGMLATASRLYVEVLTGGPSELRVYTLAGKPLPTPASEPVSTVQLGTRLAGDAILFGNQSFVTPFAWYRLDPKQDGGQPVKTMLSAPPENMALENVQVTRVMARSKDGTQVPVNIVAAKDVKLDGTNPTLMTAYGGYGLSMQPRFSRRNVFWLRHGGVYALVNTRGGGEFGEAWHLAGNLTKKQNVFDDFAAAAQLMIDRGYTSSKKLAIEGGSNGGLLMGAELVQHPELFAAVVSHVGIYDMLRVELTPNGAFNVTEFGTVKDPAQFDALHAYSPLHHVEDGKNYPAVMFLTGINDGRVDPWQSLKMTARLQAVNPRGQPVLLRVAGDAGHGQGMSLSSSIEQDADVFAFLFDRLAVTPPAAAVAAKP